MGRIGVLVLAALGGCELRVGGPEDPPPWVVVELQPTACAFADREWVGVTGECPLTFTYTVDRALLADPSGYTLTIHANGLHPKFPLDSGAGTFTFTPRTNGFKHEDSVSFELVDPRGTTLYDQYQARFLTIVKPGVGSPPAWLFTTYWTYPERDPDCEDDVRIVVVAGGDLAATSELSAYLFDVDTVDSDDPIETVAVTPIAGTMRYELRPTKLCTPDSPDESLNNVDPDYTVSLKNTQGMVIDTLDGDELDVD